MKTLEKSIFQGYKTIYNHACEKIKQVFDLEKAKAVGKKSSGRFGEAFGTKRQTKRKKDRFLFPRSILTNQSQFIVRTYFLGHLAPAFFRILFPALEKTLETK